MQTTAPTPEDRLRGEIKAEMARRGLTRQTLAPQVGMSPWALGRRLSGDTDFSFREAVTVAQALDIDADNYLPRAGSAA